MKIFLRVVFGIVALPVVLLLYAIISARLDRPARISSDNFRPIGLRMSPYVGEPMEISGYRSAWMQSYHLDNDVRPIIEEMGLNYLNALKSFQGGDDGYSSWKVGPLDPEVVVSLDQQNSRILAAIEKEICTIHWDGPDRGCVMHKGMLTKQEVYYAYGSGQIAILDPARSYLQVMYLGPPS